MTRLMELHGDTLANCRKALGSHPGPMQGDELPASAVSRGAHLLLYPHNRAWTFSALVQASVALMVTASDASAKRLQQRAPVIETAQDDTDA
jgi:hypothetical protein